MSVNLRKIRPMFIHDAYLSSLFVETLIVNCYFSGELIGHNEHPSRGCFHLALISQIIRLKQCG